MGTSCLPPCSDGGGKVFSPRSLKLTHIPVFHKLCTRLALMLCYQLGKGHNDWVVPVGVVVWVVAGNLPHVFDFSDVHVFPLFRIRSAKSRPSGSGASSHTFAHASRSASTALAINSSHRILLASRSSTRIKASKRLRFATTPHTSSGPSLDGPTLNPALRAMSTVSFTATSPSAPVGTALSCLR